MLGPRERVKDNFHFFFLDDYHKEDFFISFSFFFFFAKVFRIYKKNEVNKLLSVFVRKLNKNYILKLKKEKKR